MILGMLTGDCSDNYKSLVVMLCHAQHIIFVAAVRLNEIAAVRIYMHAQNPIRYHSFYSVLPPPGIPFFG